MTKQAPFFRLASRQKNKVLNYYQIQLHQQRVMLGIIKSALPDALKERASHCVANHNKICIYTTSAAWASQLRFYANDMLAALHQRHDHTHFESVQIRLLAADPTNATHVRDPNIPSLPMIKLIIEARGHQDDILSNALKALGNTLGGKRTKHIRQVE